MTLFPSTNNIAFKEWAAVVAALAAGEQSIILRKGGIHEGRAGFNVDHDRFWLFPTAFHQESQELAPAARPFLNERKLTPPPDGRIALQHFVQVEAVRHLTSLDELTPLRPFHLWSDEIVHSRFHYRTPGLFCLVVRVWNRDTPHLIDDLPAFGGCRSWVPLPTPLPVDHLAPALDDATHADRLAALQRLAAVGS